MAGTVVDTTIWTGDESSRLKRWHPLHRPARLPADETERLEALASLNLGAYTANDSFFNTMALITKRTFRSDTTKQSDAKDEALSLSAAVNFIEAEFQWSKAAAGYDMCKVHRDISLCAHAIIDVHERAGTMGCLVVLDTAADKRFQYSDVCLLDPYPVRFYAGIPVYVTWNAVQWPIGTLCIFDTKPRAVFSEEECRMLAVLGNMISVQLASPINNDRLPVPSLLHETTEQKIDFLKKCMAFEIRKVDDESIEKIANKLRPRVFEANSRVTRQGDASDAVYFVVSGSLTCSLNGQELEVLTRGQCFGEVSLMNISRLLLRGVSIDEALTRCRRSNDVFAGERAELLELSMTDAWPLFKEIPNLWYTLRDMAKERMNRLKRLRASNLVGVDEL